MSAKGTGPRIAVRNVRQARVEINGLDPAKGAPVEVLFAIGTVASGYKNALVTGVTGKRIRVLSVWAVGDGTRTFKFVSGTATAYNTSLTALTPTAQWPVAGTYLKDEHGIFQTAAAGDNLSVEASANTGAATVTVAYVLV